MKKIQNKIANALSSISKSILYLSIKIRYFGYPPESVTLAEYYTWKSEHPLYCWYFETFVKPIKKLYPKQ